MFCLAVVLLMGNRKLESTEGKDKLKSSKEKNMNWDFPWVKFGEKT